MTYQGKLYAVPQVTDMQLLVYRKSMLQKAGVQPPQTVDELIAAAKTLTTNKVKGLFVGNDGGVGVLGGPLLWSAGLDYLDQGQHVRASTTPQRADGVRQAAHAVHQRVPAARGAHRLVGPVGDQPGADRDAVDRPVDPARSAEAPRRRLRRPAVPQLNGSGGKPSVPVGAYGSCVSAKSQNVDAAKAFVKWLWVDQTDDQLDWAQSLRLPHPGRARAWRPRRPSCKTRPGRRRGAGSSTRTATPSRRCCGRPRRQQRSRDAAHPHRHGRRRPDAADQAAIKAVADAELKRVAG